MNFKKTFLAILILLLTLTLAVACNPACEHADEDGNGVCDICSETVGEPTPQYTVYTVTLKDQYNQPAAGLPVILQVNTKKLNGITDANGVASFEVTDKNIIRLEAEVNTVSMPAVGVSEYNREGDYFAEFAEGARNVNIQVERFEAQYVYVQDSDGNAIVGAELQICHTMCPATLFATDENGRATVYFPNPVTYAIVKNAPAGYAFDVTEHFYAPASGDFIIVLSAAK